MRLYNIVASKLHSNLAYCLSTLLLWGTSAIANPSVTVELLIQKVNREGHTLLQEIRPEPAARIPTLGLLTCSTLQA